MRGVCVCECGRFAQGEASEANTLMSGIATAALRSFVDRNMSITTG